jgi:hypothetical protein
MAAELKRLRHRAYVNRALIAIVAIVAALAIYNTSRISHVASQANQIRAGNLAACRQANVSRAEQIHLWAYVINVSTAKKTPRHEKVVAGFEAYLHKTFQARDCMKLYGIRP